MKTLVVNKGKNALPEYAHADDACMDLKADFSNGFNEDLGEGAAWDEVSNCVNLFPGGRCLIPTGLKVAVPYGYELQVRPRSGLAIKSGISVLNTPGTIDANYRGEVGVILFNFSDNVFQIHQGDRIAQAKLSKYEKIEWECVEVLPETDRGEGGFGSSGVK